MNQLTFNQADSRIEITLADGSPVATYRYDEKLPKPCLHPLYTAAGNSITDFQPSDHIWHRGLWFAIKFINRSNFWEERAPFGTQKTLGEPKCELASPESVKIASDLEWTSPSTGPVIREDRTIIVTALPGGTRQIDWTTHLLALQDLFLDRTPYTTWGGYGGLAFRASPEVQAATFLLPNGQSSPTLAGQPDNWVILRASIRDNARFSVGMIDHPSNPRSPMPWYCRAEPGYNVIFAAFLFHGPMTVARGKQLTLRHRVVFRDGWWDAAEFENLAGAFRGTPG